MSTDAQAKSRYFEVYERWKRDPEGFWAEAAQAIDWIEQPKKIFDPTQGVYGRWFTGGVTNTAYNCLDRHACIIFEMTPEIGLEHDGSRSSKSFQPIEQRARVLQGIPEVDVRLARQRFHGS